MLMTHSFFRSFFLGWVTCQVATPHVDTSPLASRDNVVYWKTKRKIKDDRPLLRANASLLSGLMRRLPPFCACGKDIRSS
jgi:hypothetical protein